MALIGFLLLMMDPLAFHSQYTLESIPLDSEFLLQSPVSFAMDDQGQHYLLDLEAKTIFVWDAKGRFSKTIGRPGKGPGEFELPHLGNVRTYKNRLYVADANRRKIHEFHDHQFYKTYKLKGGRITKFETTANGRFVAEFQRFRGESPMTQTWLLDSEFNKLKLLAEDLEEMWKKNNKGGWTFHYFSGEIEFYTHPKLDHIVLGHTHESEFKIFDLEGNLIETKPYKAQRLPITDALKEYLFYPSVFSNPKLDYVFPDYLPYFTKMMVIPQGIMGLNVVGPDMTLAGFVSDRGQTRHSFYEKFGQGGLLLVAYPKVMVATLDEEGDFVIEIGEMVAKSTSRGFATTKAALLDKE